VIGISLLLFIMWIVFANLRKYTKEKYHISIRAVATVYSVLFIFVDFLFNQTLGNIIFAFGGWKTLTLSARLREIIFRSNSDWRSKLAVFICVRLVEPWDYNHCNIIRLGENNK